MGVLPGATPALVLPGPGCHVQAGLGKGDVMPARGLVGCMTGLASRALAPQPVHGRVDECALAGAHFAPPLPACGLGSPDCGLQTATGAIWFAHALGVTVHVLDKSARALGVTVHVLDKSALALGVTVHVLDKSARALWAAAGSDVIVCGHAVPATGLVTVRGYRTDCFSLLTGPGHRGEVGGQGGVAGIVWRLMVPPGIAVTLGCGWSLLLQLRAAPSLSPSLRCRTSSGCSSACWGPVNSGMRLQALCFRLLPVSVVGCCLVPLRQCR